MRAAAAPEARGLLRVLLIRLGEVPFATGRGARQVTETASHQDRARVAALRKGVLLAGVTVSYNALEGLVAILAGLVAVRHGAQGGWKQGPPS